MRDEFGRDIRYLRLSVTDRCNCRCVYCMPENGVPMLSHADILSFEEMRDIVAAAASLGVRKVRLTGGEPLVRRGIVDLVGMVAAVPGIDEVDMTTNATLLAPVAASLRDAGLTRLNVSLDTLNAARYKAITRRGTLADALAGLAAAHDAGFANTKINCVLIGGVNDDELRPLAELARDRDLTVRFIELMRMGECAGWPKGRFVSADEVLSAVPELVRVGGQGVSELYQAPGWKGSVGLIRPMTHRFCSSCDRIRVTADGRLKPCLHSAAEVNLRGLSGQDLAEAIRAGIAAKPRGHRMDNGRASDSLRAMNEIGG
ncbi:cyclic pyranopterin monophosphate synthase subunit MoaA [Olsenella sp. KH3B4]|uniref:GTP 3',8-cyclase MoaA n=1 Tax=Olsenella sp. KH3B4 TaxID=1855394 RepID=UPI0008ACA997|nr:GTP 3',8-cyclase MoaA [Olsenella sp. KH3B4]SES76612.1 cyclic pyranopterin monophosphate synthase subunit MoaA [Olsenella sp. KH3B4]